MNNSNEEQYTQKDIDNAITKLRFDSDCSDFKTLVSKGFDINHKHVSQIIDLVGVNLKTIEELVDIGFNINIKNNLKMPLFFGLVKDNFNVESIKRIASLKGIDLNATDMFGSNILSELSSMCEDYIEDELEEEATLGKKDEMILPLLKVFIENITDYKADARGGSILFKYREYPKVLAYLFRLDLNLEDRARSGMTVFLNFCYHQNEVENATEFTKLWINSGVDIYALNNQEESDLYGFNALMTAIKGKNLDTVKVLLNENYHINYRSPKGHSAFTIALDTMNQELIDLIQERVEDPFSDPIVIEKMVKLKVKEQNWEQVIEWGNKIEEQQMSSGETLSFLSRAYQKTGHMEKSLGTMKRAIELFGLDNSLLDGLVLGLIHAGNFSELVALWYENKSHFKADEGEAANIIANFIVGFDQAGKSAEAIYEFAPLVEDAEGTKESKDGLLNFNLACMFGKNGNEVAAVEQILKALKGDFVIAELSDPDFDNIREGDLFKQLIMQASDSIYFYFKKESECRTIYTRDSKQYDSISFSNKKYITIKREFESTLDMIKAVDDEKNDLLRQGFNETAPDFVSIWLQTFDSIFKSMSQKDLKPLTEFRMEWDFCFDEDEESNPLERPYYCYSEEGYDNDGYDLLHIPQKKYHTLVMDEVVKLESFKELNKSEEVKLIQSEHDSGDEFVYVWSVS